MAQAGIQQDKVEGRINLSRDRIADVALAMIDRDGLEALSMRRLASELDVTPMALYNHVPNKEALLTAVLERLLGQIDLPEVEELGWKESLRGGIRSFRDLLVRHPAAITLIQEQHAVSPEAYEPIEFSLSLFHAAGMDPQQALYSHWTLLGYVIGHVSFQMNKALTDEGRNDFLHALNTGKLPEEKFPCLISSLPLIVDCDFDAAFDHGLEVLLRGFEVDVAGA
jgi:TetR/AcrR family transcriptional regulator, tetracycline repressor protein